MKNILIPTDFSNCARAAEDIGLDIAKKSNSEIHFLHLLNTPVDWAKLPLKKEELYPDTKEQIGYAKNELNKLVRRAEKMGLKVQEFLVYDKGNEEIYQHTTHHQHDFIIMGSHGINGFKEIVGSNAQKVVRNSNVPVMVIKEKPKKFDIQNIVFASTFKENVDPSFHKVVEFADLMKAQIHLLNVNLPYNFKETDEAESDMQAFLEKCPRGTCKTHIYNALNEERGIQKFAERINADLIAMTTHGKSGFLRLMAPSITESIINHSKKPVLSVNI